MKIYVSCNIYIRLHNFQENPFFQEKNIGHVIKIYIFYYMV